MPPNDRVGTELVLENERVRIWRFDLQPGEGLPMHEHRFSYVVVVLQGGIMEEQTPEGARERITSRDGEALFMQPSVIHSTKNVGPSNISAVVVELKSER